MENPKRDAETEIVKETVKIYDRKVNGQLEEPVPSSIEDIQKRVERAAKLSASSAMRIGLRFLNEIDVKKH